VCRGAKKVGHHWSIPLRSCCCFTCLLLCRQVINNIYKTINLGIKTTNFLLNADNDVNGKRSIKK
jgi:hypothetical protein